MYVDGEFVGLEPVVRVGQVAKQIVWGGARKAGPSLQRSTRVSLVAQEQVSPGEPHPDLGPLLGGPLLVVEILQYRLNEQTENQAEPALAQVDLGERGTLVDQPDRVEKRPTSRWVGPGRVGLRLALSIEVGGADLDQGDHASEPGTVTLLRRHCQMSQSLEE